MTSGKGNEMMLVIEATISVVNIVSVYLLTHGRVKAGCTIGLFSQFAWISLFTYTEQYGILPLEVVCLGLYMKGFYDTRFRINGARVVSKRGPAELK